MEHGAITIPAPGAEPLAMLAPMSRTLCTRVASASTSARRFCRDKRGLVGSADEV
jgi:hypothetical protein